MTKPLSDQHYRIRAADMAQVRDRMTVIVEDKRLPNTIRYEAAVMADHAEELRMRFLGLVEPSQ